MLGLVIAGGAVATTPASQNQSEDGWPRITGMLLMNKTSSSRPLDARPGRDPFGGRDRRYSCDEIHKRGKCKRRLVRCPAGSALCERGQRVVTDHPGHNELLGHHGHDTIHAGPWGDVIWGDHKASGQPATQHDRLHGGRGRDFIYGSHGWNTIKAGAGKDFVKTHWGRGIIDCGPGRDRLYISHRARPHYKIRNCERISHKTRR